MVGFMGVFSMIGCRALRDLARSALRPSFFFGFSFTKVREEDTKVSNNTESILWPSFLFKQTTQNAK
jgi:hypothetical protein